MNTRGILPLLSYSEGCPIPVPHVMRVGYPLPGTEVPPRKGSRTSHWSMPQKGHGTCGNIMGWRCDNLRPPPCDCVNRQTDAQQLSGYQRNKWRHAYIFPRFSDNGFNNHSDGARVPENLNPSMAFARFFIKNILVPVICGFGIIGNSLR